MLQTKFTEFDRSASSLPMLQTKFTEFDRSASSGQLLHEERRKVGGLARPDGVVQLKS
jgi:hypothetical protein